MKTLIYIVTIISLASCTDLSDELYDRLPPEIYPENEIQGATITTPVYKPMQDFLDWGGWWFAQEVTGDAVAFPTRHTDWDDGGKWRVLHQHTWTNTTEAIEAMWPRFYNGIGQANQLIESLEPGASEPSVALTIAKLKIMRGYYYYLLIDNYGDVPYVTSFLNAEKNPQKTKRADIWNSIVKEIEESAVLLQPGKAKNAVTKGMAYSLLTKLYLNAEVYSGTAHWDKAEQYADSVLSLGYNLESNPLGPFITENQNSPENIFTIPYDEDTYNGFNLHMRTLHYASNKTFEMTSGPWNGCAVVKDFYDKYEAEDIRKKEGFLVGQQYSFDGTKLFDETAGSDLIFNPIIPALKMDASYSLQEIRMSGARIIKFEIKKGAKDNLSNDFPIFRLADAMLMKAEAMLRQGKSANDAIAFVNPLRERAGVNIWNGNDLTLETLFEERSREMFFEGHRRQDLIRFGKFNKSWWEKEASDESRNTFPIPQTQLDSNPNL